VLFPSQNPTTTLPYTQFRPKQNQQNAQILSASQTSIPVFLVATEHAHQIAWKNGLYLSDMLEGLVQNLFANTNNNTPLAPFRSVTRSLIVTWDDLANVTFTKPDRLLLLNNNANLPGGNNSSNEVAAGQLQQAAIMQESDGNLQHELAVLEDQIDNLLCDENEDADSSSNSTGGGGTGGNGGGSSSHDVPRSYTDPMGEYERIQRRQEQATKDAFQLTSPLNIPWLWRYRQALDESTSAAAGTMTIQHELFACPAVILTVCTTAEELNPHETARILQSQHYLPANC
jgi:hypothetical protein